jgi:chemotaxis protein histidine kinase CheA
MGATRFAALAHRLEDLADLGRQGRSLPAEAFDLLLAGVDVLEGCVVHVEAGVIDPDAGDLAGRPLSALARFAGDPNPLAAAVGPVFPIHHAAGWDETHVRAERWTSVARLGLYEGPVVETWHLPETPLGRIMGKLSRFFGRRP